MKGMPSSHLLQCKGLNNTNMVNADLSEVAEEPTWRSWKLAKINATLYEIWGFIMVVSNKITAFQDVRDNI
jgi:hypothetical protein